MRIQSILEWGRAVAVDAYDRTAPRVRRLNNPRTTTGRLVYLISVLVLVAAAAVTIATTGCYTTTAGPERFDRIPSSVLPTNPDDPAQVAVLEAWLETNVVGDDDVPEGDDDTPDKPNVGPTYCREITPNLQYCTTVGGDHHWLTPTGCYDTQSGDRVECR